MQQPAERSHPSTPRLAVFVSGTGRTLRNLAQRIEHGALNAELALVLASSPCPAAEWAKERDIPTLIEPGNLSAARVLELAETHRLDFIALAGYLRLLPIPEPLLGRVTNIHPSLLPEFGGKGMHGMNVHRAVIAAGRTTSGCTVHLCDNQYDPGPIHAQASCPVLPGDTPEALAARVFQLELELYPAALQSLIAERGTRSVA
jgi:phosphoribosylglycinamide formyltransferase-1